MSIFYIIRVLIEHEVAITELYSNDQFGRGYIP